MEDSPPAGKRRTFREAGKSADHRVHAVIIYDRERIAGGGSETHRGRERCAAQVHYANDAELVVVGTDGGAVEFHLKCRCRAQIQIAAGQNPRGECRRGVKCSAARGGSNRADCSRATEGAAVEADRTAGLRAIDQQRARVDGRGASVGVGAAQGQ